MELIGLVILAGHHSSRCSMSNLSSTAWMGSWFIMLQRNAGCLDVLPIVLSFMLAWSLEQITSMSQYCHVVVTVKLVRLIYYDWFQNRCGLYFKFHCKYSVTAYSNKVLLFSSLFVLSLQSLNNFRVSNCKSGMESEVCQKWPGTGWISLVH